LRMSLRFSRLAVTVRSMSIAAASAAYTYYYGLPHGSPGFVVRG
jgi:hypothetical protein